MAFSDQRRAFDHVGNFNFIVEVDGISAGAFKNVDGLSAEVSIVEYQDGNDLVLRKRPGRTKYGDITVKRGYVEDNSLFNWFMRGVEGKIERKSVSIILLNSAGDEVVRYNLFETWPSKWKGFTLDGKADDAAVEEITFCVEKWERVISESATAATGVIR
ncbi:MAG: phage tail protein [Myxococcales bacterium]|nr:phage tail protein [Myxococcales bacterium]MCB1185041.1 phage tail protein [bacterium]MCB9549542.1 phage tail protein [Myxococcales bacterium]